MSACEYADMFDGVASMQYIIYVVESVFENHMRLVDVDGTEI